MVNLVALIKTKIAAMQTVNSVYDYEKAWDSSVKFPVATVTLHQGEGRFETTAHNLRINQFYIRVYQEKVGTVEGGQGASNAERISRQTLDEMLTAFDSDTTLSGNVKWVTPVRWSAAYVDREMDSRVLEVIVETHELVASI